MKTNTSETTPSPSSIDCWPEDGLEAVEECPVCKSEGRELMYEHLKDLVFSCAPGEWSLYRCTACGSGYLDPRPTRESIGLAYREYFTHQESTSSISADGISRPRRWLRVLANGYLNRRYGARLEPANPLGYFIALGIRHLRRDLDRRFRFLPRGSRRQRVLDIGCGRGEFLHWASQAGWDTYGVEPDSKAARQASEVVDKVWEASIEALIEDGELVAHSFEAVTLSHVIEHLHDPVTVLRAVKAAMTPNGHLYIDTPNLDSFGHGRFGRYWLGLDPPRHLVIFNHDSLVSALREAGFSEVSLIGRYEAPRSTFPQSRMIAAGLEPYGEGALRPGCAAYLAGLAARLRPERTEFVTLTARA